MTGAAGMLVDAIGILRLNTNPFAGRIPAYLYVSFMEPTDGREA